MRLLRPSRGVYAERGAYITLRIDASIYVSAEAGPPSRVTAAGKAERLLVHPVLLPADLVIVLSVH
jgi:hypothetical protein